MCAIFHLQPIRDDNYTVIININAFINECSSRNESSVIFPLTKRSIHLEFVVPETLLNENNVYIKLEQ